MKELAMARNLLILLEQATEKESQGGGKMASYRSEHEKRGPDGIPALEELEVGRPVGAILPMSEHAQVALRDSIELVDYLMNQDAVTWN